VSLAEAEFQTFQGLLLIFKNNLSIFECLKKFNAVSRPASNPRLAREPRQFPFRWLIPAFVPESILRNPSSSQLVCTDFHPIYSLCLFKQFAQQQIHLQVIYHHSWT